MDKQTLIRDIKQSNDGAGLLNITQAGKYLNMERHAAKRFLAGVEHLNLGREKKYAAIDIAQRIIEKRTI